MGFLMFAKEIVPYCVGRRGITVTKKVNCARVPEKIGVTVTKNHIYARTP